MAAALRVMVILIGLPVRNVAKPESDQPPRILDARPLVRYCLPCPKGSSQTPLLVMVWRTSMSLLLRSQARQPISWKPTLVPDPSEASVMPLRPHVIHLEQQAADEPALDGGLHGVEVVVAVVGLQAERAERGQ